jgi:hypothetical protein
VSSDFFQEAGCQLVHESIVEFYTATWQYEMDVWTRWEPLWGFFGRVVDRIFARRINQLRLPADSLAAGRGVSSEIIQLQDAEGKIRHTLWLRKLKFAKSVIYAGFYYHVKDPRGESRVKVVFPLPHGSATVVMSVGSLEGGKFKLSSAGSRFGDPGFYFIVKDSRGDTWIRYLKAFHEFIDVWHEPEGIIRADHTMKLWGMLCYSLHYRVKKGLTSR